MKNYAFLVGINNYPSAPLRGCVNDINDLAEFLVSCANFKAPEIRMLTDERATTSAITEGLQRMVKDAKPGNRLLFHYSGHGVQLPTTDHEGELDGLDEAICPFDFDWTQKHTLRDKDFVRLFRPVPKGVHFIWISDSCHSGDLSRNLSASTLDQTEASITPPAFRAAPGPGPLIQELFPMIRWLGMPADMAWALRAAMSLKLPLVTMADAARKLNLALITACRSNQTAGDANFKGRFNGALTHFLIKTLKAKGGLSLPLERLVPKIRSALAKAHFSQQPQLEGSKALFRVPFMAG